MPLITLAVSFYKLAICATWNKLQASVDQAIAMLMRRQVSAQRRHISAQACIWASSPMLAQSWAQRSHTSAQAPQK